MAWRRVLRSRISGRSELESRRFQRQEIFMRYISFGLVVALLALPSAADARVKKIVIEKKVSPAFDGATFGPAGQYETIAGRAFGELDPADSRNASITDIKLAPRNAAGKGEY